MGGVSTIFSPTTILKARDVSPALFLAWSVTLYSPGLLSDPEILPDSRSILTPAGRWSAENLTGRSPVAGMVNSIGWFGRTPKTFGPLMRGAGPFFGVRMYFESVSCACNDPAQNPHIRMTILNLFISRLHVLRSLLLPA